MRASERQSSTKLFDKRSDFSFLDCKNIFFYYYYSFFYFFAFLNFFFSINKIEQKNSPIYIFIPKPMISFSSARKLSSHLIRAKLYPEERNKGFFKCGSKRCEVCLIVNETSTFASTVTGEKYTINHKFNRPFPSFDDVIICYTETRRNATTLSRM